MVNRVVIGGQWGDEGKGKIVDTLSRDVDWVLRYQGGANAGHTIHIGPDKHVLHLVPSGALHAGVKCLLGGGMVIDPWSLRDEILALEHDIVPERYIRNMNALSIKDQITLLQSRVCIVGLGGLGGTVVETLARIGVGAMTVVDGDVFDESNLNP